MKITAKLEMGPVQKILAKHDLEKGGAVQRYIDSEVIRQCEPYVPFDSGALTASASLNTRIGSGLVIYRTLYAHYQYYGEVYGPNIPVKNKDGKIVGWVSKPDSKKTPTGKKLQYNKEVHPQAGSFWFERMLADHKDDILKGAKKAAGVK